ncbi:MAG: hypothetical protein R6U21_08015 [Thermoplasmatota archaeon]
MEDNDCIYGVGLEETVTPVKVRDAIIHCFCEADDEIMDQLFQSCDFGSAEEGEQKKLKHVEILIKKMFQEVNGDFDNPTKESLIGVIDKCAAYAGSVRDKETINKNYDAIMSLIERLE